MDYEEVELPDALAPFVSCVWTLSAREPATKQVTFEALPDGCVELIHRHTGQSSWRGAQPSCFAAGLCTSPAQLIFSGDAQFTSVRLWPWAWTQLGGPPVAAFHDRWLEVEPTSPAAQLISDPIGIIERLIESFAEIEPDPIGKHVPAASNTGDLAARCGKGHRMIQRWFARNIGLTPRKYFKLLRFQQAIGKVPGNAEPLAHEAARLGYSDQSHMARDFRQYSGQTTSQIRALAKGPFIAA